MGFSENFIWGAGSSSHQIEGAYLSDGKTLNIWDMSEGKNKRAEDGKVACDHYRRYREDVALMKKIGLKAYRFSISWARVIPEEGKVNRKGLQFYIDLVQELEGAGIEPMVTLFHWDLPLWAHKRGGWKNKKIADWFAHYIKIVVDALSDKVKYWITINEPQYFMGMGYVTGKVPPYQKSVLSISKITKNIMFAHAEAVKIIRTCAKRKPLVGFAPTGQSYTPQDETAKEIERAKKRTFGMEDMMFSNSWWADPMILGKNPNDGKGNFLLKLSEQELKRINQPLDFYGFNVYHSKNFYEGKKLNSEVYPGMPRTSMGWTITPEVLYWSTRFFFERYQLPIIITENGMANNDFIMLDGEVSDPQRIDFIKRHLLQLHRAVEEGIPVLGYLYWSIMDNFEWTDGYDKRFGLIYVDYKTQKRTLKDSAYYYGEVIKSNGGNLL